MAKYDVYIYTPVEDPNLEMTRIRPETAAVADRLDAFREIERTYTPRQAAQEAARCLNCPTHWCQQKCPIGMDVPGFIAKIREGDIEGALSLIHISEPTRRS